MVAIPPLNRKSDGLPVNAGTYTVKASITEMVPSQQSKITNKPVAAE